MHILLAIWLSYLNIKNKAYHKLLNYLPSIVYVISFNWLFYFLCGDHLVWRFCSKILNAKKVQLLHVFWINANLILLYLSKMPKTLLEEIIYIGKWTLVSTAFEWLGWKKLNMLRFYYGWNLGWSFVAYIMMYLFSFLMIKPSLRLKIWVLSFISTVFFLLAFKIPLKITLPKQFKKRKDIFGGNPRFIVPLVILIIVSNFIKPKKVPFK